MSTFSHQFITTAPTILWVILVLLNYIGGVGGLDIKKPNRNN